MKTNFLLKIYLKYKIRFLKKEKKSEEISSHFPIDLSFSPIYI
jgi:hypothetical protein